MTLTVVHEGRLTIVEGPPDRPLMSSLADIHRVIEQCFSDATQSVLLYAENLTPAFFDLSSGEAAAILQKLRNYGIRLAVVCVPDRARFSSRFGEMADEESRGNHFRLFPTRDAAREWLNRGTIHAQDGPS